MLASTKTLGWIRGIATLLPVSRVLIGELLNSVANHGFNSVLLFYITYIFFELPSNMALKKVGAPRWLALLTVCFGLATLGIGLAQNYATLLALRIILGTMEAVGGVPRWKSNTVANSYYRVSFQGASILLELGTRDTMSRKGLINSTLLFVSVH